ncbi:MAG: hypothetical protein ACPGWR_27740 [Ardenticatenaceae bacterium]
MLSYQDVVTLTTNSWKDLPASLARNDEPTPKAGEAQVLQMLRFLPESEV